MHRLGAALESGALVGGLNGVKDLTSYPTEL